MNTLVEKVARAIAEAAFGKGSPVVDEDYRSAVAALKAMREPSEAMINAAFNDYVERSPDETPQQKFARWLEEGPKLAKAAGCYVAIKVLPAPDQTTPPRNAS